MNGKLLIGLAAVSAISVTALAAFADVHSASYKGSKLCVMCHQKTDKAIVDAYKKSPHARSMQKAGDAGAIVGDFAKNKAFKKSDVAFVVGSGRHQQAYLNDKLQVLPALWDVKTKAWTPTKAVDASTQCIGCHATNFDPVKKEYKEMGAGCESCHGPGGDHAGKPKENPVVHLNKLTPAQQAMVCGQCHSAGKDTSGKHAFPVNYRPTDDLTKSFVDAKPTAPGPNQQYSEWLQSTHAKNGVTCVTCHEPHNNSKNPAQLKKPMTELCLSCHSKTIEDQATHAPKAPAGATCATCHMPNGQHNFAKAKAQ